MARAAPNSVDDRLRRRSLDVGATEDPRTFGKRVGCIDLTSFGGEPQRLLADAKKLGRAGQVEPGFDAVRGRAPDRNAVMRAQRRDGDPAASNTCARSLGWEVVDAGNT